MATSKFQVYTPSIQQVFVDKDTQKVMSGGKVYFYFDNNRTQLKDIYELTGVPGNYEYIPLENPQTLDMAGAFKQAVYLLPFDEDGNAQPYYVYVENADGIQQLNRENFPSLEGIINDSTDVLVNYIINPQFSLNYGQFPIYDDTALHEKTAIAPFGWSFVKSPNSNSKDKISFRRFDSFTSNPRSNPRYAVRVECLQTGNDEIKALRLMIPNVNFLSSSDDTIDNTVTFSFSAISNSSSFLNGVELFLVKNFGSGGTPSPEEETLLDNYIFTNNFKTFTTSFSMGNNDGKNLGDDDTDFIAIDVRFPPNAILDTELTDFIFTPGQVTDPICPEFNLDTINGMVVTGDIKIRPAFSFAFIDTGYLPCDGREVSRDTFSDLYSITAFYVSGRTALNQPLLFNTTTTAGSPLVTVSASDLKSLYVGMQFTSPNFTGTRTILSINSDVTFTADGNSTTSSTVISTFITNRNIYDISPGVEIFNLFVGMEFTSPNFTGIVKIVAIYSTGNTVTSIVVDKDANIASTVNNHLFYMNGAGNGVDTFNVPDFVGRVPMGFGGTKAPGISQKIGADEEVINPENLPSHNHDFNLVDPNVLPGVNGADYGYLAGGGTGPDAAMTTNTAGRIKTFTTAGGNGLLSKPISIIQKSLSTFIYIKT